MGNNTQMPFEFRSELTNSPRCQSVGHILRNYASPSRSSARTWLFDTFLVMQMHGSSDGCIILNGMFHFYVLVFDKEPQDLTLISIRRYGVAMTLVLS